MGCGVSTFQHEETAELSNNSHTKSIHDHSNKHGQKNNITTSVSSQANNNNSDLKIITNNGGSEVDEDLDQKDSNYSNRRDGVNYPGSPSFRVYCTSEVNSFKATRSRNNNHGNNMADHEGKKRSSLVSRNNMDEPPDVEEEPGVESSVVKKESKVRRFRGSALWSSLPRKSLHHHQKS